MILPTPPVIDTAALAGAQAAHHFASVIRSGWQAVWQRDPAIVAAEINADLTKSSGIFQLNEQAANAVNALLDAVNDDRFPARAPVAMPPGWTVGEAGFVYTAPETESEPAA